MDYCYVRFVLLLLLLLDAFAAGAVGVGAGVLLVLHAGAASSSSSSAAAAAARRFARAMSAARSARNFSRASAITSSSPVKYKPMKQRPAGSGASLDISAVFESSGSGSTGGRVWFEIERSKIRRDRGSFYDHYLDHTVR